MIEEKECCATCHFWRRHNETGVFQCNNIDSDNVGRMTKPLYGCFQYEKEREVKDAD